MNNAPRCDSMARERHRTLDFIGLRAHATTVGFIQLCEELMNSGILEQDGLDRIKSAIISELSVTNSRISNQAHFDETLRRRIDSIFPKAPGVKPDVHVGPAEEFEEAIDHHHLG